MQAFRFSFRFLAPVSRSSLSACHPLTVQPATRVPLWRVALVAAGAAFALGSAPWAQAQGSHVPVRIGVIGPFTGASADFGVPMLNGIKLAVDEINAVGGYLGRPLELIVKDDMADPARGRQAAQELLSEKVSAVLGFCNTGVALKALDLFQQSKTPLIVPCATGTAVTSTYPAPESYIFRVQGRDALQAPLMVDEIIKRGWDKVAIFADTTGYGEGGYKDVVDALAAKNLKPVHVSRFPLGVKDLSAELAENFGMQPGTGVIISGVLQNGPAAQAGVRPGDVITAVAGRQVNSVAQLLSAVAGLAPGKPATLDVVRRDGTTKIEVTPGRRNLPRQQAAPR